METWNCGRCYPLTPEQPLGQPWMPLSPALRQRIPDPCLLALATPAVQSTLGSAESLCAAMTAMFL
eukprot:6444110-Amphidinium_carterae.1